MSPAPGCVDHCLAFLLRPISSRTLPVNPETKMLGCHRDKSPQVLRGDPVLVPQMIHPSQDVLRCHHFGLRNAVLHHSVLGTGQHKGMWRDLNQYWTGEMLKAGGAGGCSHAVHKNSSLKALQADTSLFAIGPR